MGEGGGASRTTDPAAGTSAATDVSLRELVATWRVDDRSRTRERFAWLGALIAFAWYQVQLRLENLNHENARILAAQQRSVSADTYTANEEQRDKEAEELRTWRKEVDTRGTQAITRDEFQRDTKTEKRATVDTTTKLIGAVGAVVVVGLAILNYQALHRDPVAPTAPLVVTVTTSR